MNNNVPSRLLLAAFVALLLPLAARAALTAEEQRIASEVKARSEEALALLYCRRQGGISHTW